MTIGREKLKCVEKSCPVSQRMTHELIWAWIPIYTERTRRYLCYCTAKCLYKYAYQEEWRPRHQYLLTRWRSMNRWKPGSTLCCNIRVLHEQTLHSSCWRSGGYRTGLYRQWPYLALCMTRLEEGFMVSCTAETPFNVPQFKNVLYLILSLHLID
jgi:hypothetical protein